MKITFLSTYSGPVSRGVETWIFEVANRLSQNHEVTVYQLGEKDPKAKYIVKKVNVHVQWNHPSGGFFERYGLDYWSLMLARFTIRASKQIIKDKPDIIIPLNGALQTPLCKIISLIVHSKLVIFGHFTDRFSLFFRPDAYVAITDTSAKWARKFYSRKIEIIPNGIDTNLFNPQGNIYSHGLAHPVILCVGAFNKYKNIDKTILAVSKKKDASLLIVGDGLEKESLRKLADEHLQGRYKILNVKYEQMPNIYRSADLFTLVPDHSEAFGLVYLEALACGIPAVGINDEIRQSIIGSAGTYVNDPTDSDEYIEKINEAINIKPEDCIMQAKKFSLENTVKKYEDLFLEINKVN